jgi:hypothetical protein
MATTIAVDAKKTEHADSSLVHPKTLWLIISLS